jgi:hypothetical protein
MAAPTLVFLHGRGQEFKKPEQLRRKWLAALNAGLTAAGTDPLPADRVVLPFYGNVLYQVTAASAGKALRLESTRSTDEPGPFSPATPPGTGALERELLLDMARAAGMTVPDPDEPPPPVERTGGGGRLREEGLRDRILSWGPARELLVSLAKRSRVDQLVITAQLRDVAIYLSEGRDEVLEVVREAVPAEGPLVLVSHSLGTVVARDLLHDDDVRERTTLWVTAGSPLGLEAVQRNLIEPGPPAPRGRVADGLRRQRRGRPRAPHAGVLGDTPHGRRGGERHRPPRGLALPGAGGGRRLHRTRGGPLLLTQPPAACTWTGSGRPPLARRRMVGDGSVTPAVVSSPGGCPCPAMSLVTPAHPRTGGPV